MGKDTHKRVREGNAESQDAIFSNLEFQQQTLLSYLQKESSSCLKDHIERLEQSTQELYSNRKSALMEEFDNANALLDEALTQAEKDLGEQFKQHLEELEKKHTEEIDEFVGILEALQASQIEQAQKVQKNLE